MEQGYLTCVKHQLQLSLPSHELILLLLIIFVGGTATVSSSVSVASSQDDTPMLQKLKDMNKK